MTRRPSSTASALSTLRCTRSGASVIAALLLAMLADHAASQSAHPASPNAIGVQVKSPGSARSDAAAVDAGSGGDPEQLLRAIRESLIGAAIESPMRIASVAWIDEAGALQESTQWHTQMRVRGVRVLKYLQPEPAGEGEGQAAWSVQPLIEAAGRHDAVSARECLEFARPWRMGARLEVTNDGRIQGRESAVAALLVQRVRAWWAAHGSTLPRWYAQVPVPVFGLPVGASTAVAPMPLTYQQMLSGAPLQTAGAVLRLTLSGGASGEGLAARLVFDDGEGRVLWQQSRTLSAAVPQPFAGASEIGALEALLQQWRDALGTVAPCDYPRFEARPAEDRRWILPVGPESGFRPGHRVFIADRHRVPERLLDPDALIQTAIAEVVSVSTDGIALRQVAGPRLDAGSSWVAWPL